MKVTVGIKALNEERHIEAAVRSALAAVEALRSPGEVVLADSGSSDKTVEIASRYPIRVVQLANPAERCCGAGAQLAFQHAAGEYFYLLDGDMTLEPGFLRAGIAFLDAHPEMAAVGGRVVEMNTVNEGFQIRAANAQRAQWMPGEVDRLDCGGLYRSDAIRQVGWFSDRNLHAFEEFDLGARLQAQGWKLARIDLPAVEHFGHTSGGYQLLLRRIKSGYSGASGEVLRAALGSRHLPLVLRRLGHIRNGAAVVAWWALLVASLFLPFAPAPALVMILAPLLFLWWRRRSLRLGLYSLASWNVTALGLISGFFRPRVPPQTPLASVDLTPQGGLQA